MKSIILITLLAAASALGAVPADSAGSGNPLVDAHITRAQTDHMGRSDGTLDDAEITRALVTLNENEVTVDKYAARKANSTAVISYAEKMMAEHKQSIKDTKQVSKNVKYGLSKSPLSFSIKDEGKTAYKDLKKSSVTGFDRLYVQQQINMHQRALDLIDNTLLPQAQNADLKAHLSKTREAIAMHLTEAQSLQTRL